MAKGEWKNITALVDRALEILEHEHPMTIRQLFYRLLSDGHVGNTRGDYQKVSRTMTKARDDGRCPFEWVTDRSRPEYKPSVWKDAGGYAEAIKRSYRKDYWAQQPSYCEVWVEKDAIIGSIEEVTYELGVRVRVGRGFLSTTKAHEIAMHFDTIDKPITVFYLGDHDASGRTIEADVRKRVLSYGSGPFILKRLAIHAADIRKFNLPPLRVKVSDSRATVFLSKYSNSCVELDALPPVELRRRIREAIERLINRDLWNHAVMVEEVELNSIRESVKLWPRSSTA